MAPNEKILANKIKSLNARWQREMAEHERLYEQRFNNLPSNCDREVIAEAVLELNMWSRARIAEIRRIWFEGILNA